MTINTPIRVGHAYDFHRFSERRKLILGGFHIPAAFGLLGHSDADCLTHALADAILGALALPDIGHYFPDNEEINKDLDSKIILRKAIQEMNRMGYRLGNVDLTILAEKPKISHYSASIRMSLSQTMKLDKDFIGLKATTNEGTGPVGREEGIAAYAVCTLLLKDN